MIDVETQRKVHEVIGQVARPLHDLLSEQIGHRVHFILLVSTDKGRNYRDPNDSGFSAYVASNKDREGNAQLMREMASKMYAAPRERAYLRTAGDPVRFFAKRVEYTEERQVTLDEVVNGVTTEIYVDGRLSGVLLLTEAQERALLEVIHNTDKGGEPWSE